MDEFKFTPGPWHVSNENALRIRSDQSFVTVATAGYVTDEEELATAYLISSAPELLAELIKARKIIEESDEWWMDSPDRGGFDTESMDAAINKALGK